MAAWQCSLCVFDASQFGLVNVANVKSVFVQHFKKIFAVFQQDYIQSARRGPVVRAPFWSHRDIFLNLAV